MLRALRARLTGLRRHPIVAVWSTEGDIHAVPSVDGDYRQRQPGQFRLAELLARVEALARRSATVVKETVLRVGDLKLDLMSRTVTRGGRDIDLLPREFQVLEYLVRNEGHVVPRAMLLQHVWDLHFDPTTNIIDVYVGRVRRKIDSQQAYPLIHTVRGVGFCIRAPD